MDNPILTSEELTEFAEGAVNDFYGPELQSMAVELLAARRRITEQENETEHWV